MHLDALLGAQVLRDNTVPRCSYVARCTPISRWAQTAFCGAAYSRGDAQCLQPVFGKKSLSLREDRARSFERVAIRLAIVQRADFQADRQFGG